MRQRVLEVTVLFTATLLVLFCLPQSLNAQAAAQSHLYFFTSDGCAPCRHVEPAIESLHREGFPVSTVNVNRQSELANRFLVDRTPTVILVTGDRITGRHAGQIDLPTLRQWFAAVGQKPNAGSAVASSAAHGSNAKGRGQGSATRATPGTKVALNEAGTRTANSFTSPTMHKGTARPANRIEAQAMAATVRLKVEDPEGISYATGTVIHARPGEALVLTCGHVFRDAQGKGVITAEYGFDTGAIKTAPGQLIHYDAKARDIGLVAIQTQGSLTPVDVAPAGATVALGERSFSIGCDHGESPTIRHTAIKNRAKYDGEIKYDIFGRPVDGRSGGGLFTEDGQLIGVCNAAAVEVDEGIYSGIDTIHWQFAQTNLTDLFSPATALASTTSPDADRFASLDKDQTQSQREFALAMAGQRSSSPRKHIAPRRQLAAGSSRDRLSTSPASFQRQSDSDMEVIILVRSKTDPSVAETITVSDPSDKLLGYLGDMGESGKTPRQLDIAQLRRRIEYPQNAVYNGKWR
ncbi:trypsin-like peptidase domain-containing protein [Mariniblastus sp.]|nr:trypsin-like peptidase domain-containing protein [Mariniblastus sp.]